MKYNYTNENLLILLKFLNRNSSIKDGTLNGSTFQAEAFKKNIRLDSTCLDRKCSLTVDDINFIHYNNISQYVTIPYTIINRNLKYKIGDFVFYSFKKLYERYDKYLDVYDIAFSSSNVNNGYMIYFSCFKNQDSFFFRTESLKQMNEYNDCDKIELQFNHVNNFKYSQCILKMARKEI